MATDNSRKKTYSAPALEKGLDIIELLATEVDGLRIADIVSRLGRSYGELFRMLVVLEQRGYVELPDGSDRYSLTMKLFGLANQFPPVKRLTAVAGPILKRLAFGIEQSCHLVTFYDGMGHVIAQQDSPSVRNFSVKLGATASLMNTCSGHVLLSYASEEKFNMMVKRIPAHHPKPDMKVFKEFSQSIIDRGYEAIRSRQAHGVHDIGFPVFDHTDDILAVLVIPFMEFIDDSHPVTFEESKSYAKQAAQDLSQKLGATKQI